MSRRATRPALGGNEEHSGEKLADRAMRWAAGGCAAVHGTESSSSKGVLKVCVVCCAAARLQRGDCVARKPFSPERVPNERRLVCTCAKVPKYATHDSRDTRERELRGARMESASAPPWHPLSIPRTNNIGWRAATCGRVRERGPPARRAPHRPSPRQVPHSQGLTRGAGPPAPGGVYTFVKQ